MKNQAKFNLILKWNKNSQMKKLKNVSHNKILKNNKSHQIILKIMINVIKCLEQLLKLKENLKYFWIGIKKYIDNLKFGMIN